MALDLKKQLTVRKWGVLGAGRFAEKLWDLESLVKVKFKNMKIWGIKWDLDLANIIGSGWIQICQAASFEFLENKLGNIGIFRNGPKAKINKNLASEACCLRLLLQS